MSARAASAADIDAFVERAEEIRDAIKSYISSDPEEEKKHREAALSARRQEAAAAASERIRNRYDTSRYARFEDDAVIDELLKQCDDPPKPPSIREKRKDLHDFEVLCLEEAEKRKNAGNEAMKRQDYERAYEEYSAVGPLLHEGEDPELLLDADLLEKVRSNRAQAALGLKRYVDVVEDASYVLARNSAHTKCLWRRATALLQLRRPREAQADVNKLLKQEPKNVEGLRLQAAVEKELEALRAAEVLTQEPEGAALVDLLGKQSDELEAEVCSLVKLLEEHNEGEKIVMAVDSEVDAALTKVSNHLCTIKKVIGERPSAQAFFGIHKGISFVWDVVRLLFGTGLSRWSNGRSTVCLICLQHAMDIIADCYQTPAAAERLRDEMTHKDLEAKMSTPTKLSISFQLVATNCIHASFDMNVRDSFTKVPMFRISATRMLAAFVLEPSGDVVRSIFGPQSEARKDSIFAAPLSAYSSFIAGIKSVSQIVSKNASDFLSKKYDRVNEVTFPEMPIHSLLHAFIEVLLALRRTASGLSLLNRNCAYKVTVVPSCLAALSGLRPPSTLPRATIVYPFRVRVLHEAAVRLLISAPVDAFGGDDGILDSISVLVPATVEQYAAALRSAVWALHSKNDSEAARSSLKRVSEMAVCTEGTLALAHNGLLLCGAGNKDHQRDRAAFVEKLLTITPSLFSSCFSVLEDILFGFVDPSAGEVADFAREGCLAVLARTLALLGKVIPVQQHGLCDALDGRSAFTSGAEPVFVTALWAIINAFHSEKEVGGYVTEVVQHAVLILAHVYSSNQFISVRTHLLAPIATFTAAPDANFMLGEYRLALLVDLLGMRGKFTAAHGTEKAHYASPATIVANAAALLKIAAVDGSPVTAEDGDLSDFFEFSGQVDLVTRGVAAIKTLRVEEDMLARDGGDRTALNDLLVAQFNIAKVVSSCLNAGSPELRRKEVIDVLLDTQRRYNARMR